MVGGRFQRNYAVFHLGVNKAFAGNEKAIFQSKSHSVEQGSEDTSTEDVAVPHATSDFCVLTPDSLLQTGSLTPVVDRIH